MKNIAIILWMVCAAACAHPRAVHRRAAFDAPLAHQSDPIAWVDDRPIGMDDLSPKVRRRLIKIENELLQRQLHILWMGIQDTVDAQLLAQEAVKAGVDAAQMRQRLFAARIIEPSKEELRALYDANKNEIDAPFDTAQEQIRKYLIDQQKEKLNQAMLGKLRSNTNIRYNLKVPLLPRITLPQQDNAPSRGPKDARVTITVFSDFQCPFCGRARAMLDEISAAYPNDVRLVYRYFPLGQHPRAKAAAIAAHCAHQQEEFWPFHDLLFDHPAFLGDKDFIRYGNDLSLDMNEFKQCLDSRESVLAIEKHLSAGRRLGIDGTPALFINGIALIGILPMPLFKTMIDDELN